MSEDSAQFPIEGQSKEIGRYAKGVFVNAIPSTWIETELGGDADFGYDYQVQFKVGQHVKYSFRAQLKGTTKPNWIQDGKVLSFPLSTSTLNMYEHTADRTMLVVCVVPEDLPRPFEGGTFFVWVNDALPPDFEEKQERGDPQASFSIHIPVENRLTPSTDIAAYLQSHVRQFRSAINIRDLVSESLGGRTLSTEPIQVVEFALAAQPQLVTALLEQSEIWPAAPKGTAVRNLLDIAECVRHGHWEQASQLHQHIDVIC